MRIEQFTQQNNAYTVDMPCLTDANKVTHVYARQPFFLHIVQAARGSHLYEIVASSTITDGIVTQQVKSTMSLVSSPAGVLDADLSAWLRAVVDAYIEMGATLQTSTIAIEQPKQSQTDITIPMLIHDGAAPYDLADIAPVYDYKMSASWWLLPPSTVLIPDAAAVVSSLFIPTWWSDAATSYELVSAIDTVDCSKRNALECRNDETAIVLEDSGVPVHTIVPRGTCQPLVLVRWPSMAGPFWSDEVARPTKQMYWRVAKSGLASDGETVSASVGDWTLKTTTHKMTLVIDELTPYSAWWYSDIIAADVVEVLTDGVHAQRARVTTKSVIEDYVQRSSLVVELEVLQTL